MSNPWYESAAQNAVCCYDQSPGIEPVVHNNEHFPSFEQLTGNEEASKTPIMNSIMNPSNAVLLANYFYPQPSEHHLGFPYHQDVGLKPEYQESGSYNPLNYPECTKFENALRWPHNQSIAAPVHASRFWSRINRRIQPTPTKESPVKVVLENKSLMERFHEHCTEMIITKSGRRMFPSPQISIEGLEATTKYYVLFDIVPADENRYKFHHFNWVIAGKAESHPPTRLYIHPESPLTGSQWMKQQIVFHKVKLTNNTCDQHGHMILNSMHRYQPRIHIVAANDVYSIQFQTFHTFAYPECQFIAVTAYQNSQITMLKIEHNPFAKGFRKPEKEKRDKRKMNIADNNSDSKRNISEHNIKEQQRHTDAHKKPLRTSETNGNEKNNASFDFHYDRNEFSPSKISVPSTRPPPPSMNYAPASASPNQSLNITGKFPYFEQSKCHPESDYNTMYDAQGARQLPFQADFMMAHYKGNMQSFI